jgi:L-glutamine-phosphate cytidylyltransferase
MMPEPLVITLAAGKGSRLGEAARGLPKCMAMLGGRSLLDWQRMAFEELKLHNRRLVVRAEASPPLNRYESAIPVSGDGGPMDSLYAVEPDRFITDIVVCYGDIVFHPLIVKSLLDAQGDICVVADRNWHALWSMRFDSVLDDAERFRAHGASVIEIGGRANDSAEIEAQFIGMMKLSAQGFEQLRALQRVGDDSTSLLARAIAHAIPVTAVYINGRWCEVDTERDLVCYRQALSQPVPWSHDWRKN